MQLLQDVAAHESAISGAISTSGGITTASSALVQAKAIKSLVDTKAPKNHATTETTYGSGTTTNYGHVKIATGDMGTVTAITNGVAAASFHNHDGIYYTETEADNRFVNVTGDTMTGNLTLENVKYATSSATTGVVYSNGIKVNNNALVAVDIDGTGQWTGSNEAGTVVLGNLSNNTLLRTKTNLSVYRGSNKYTILDSGNSGHTHSYAPLSHTASLATTATTGHVMVGSFLSVDTTGKLSVKTGTSSSTVARGDHSHNYDDKYVNVDGDTMTGTLNVPTLSAGTISATTLSATTISGATIRGGSLSANTISGASRIIGANVNGTTVTGATICGTTIYEGGSKLADKYSPVHNHPYAPSSHTASLATTATTGHVMVGSFLSVDTTGKLSVKTGTSSSTVARGDHSHSGYSPTGHNHDDRYVNVTGDTMTGCLSIESSAWNNQLALKRNNNGSNWGPAISFYDENGGRGCLTMGEDKLYICDVGGTTSKRKEVSTTDHKHSYLPLSGGCLTGNVDMEDATLVIYDSDYFLTNELSHTGMYINDNDGNSSSVESNRIISPNGYFNNISGGTVSANSFAIDIRTFNETNQKGTYGLAYENGDLVFKGTYNTTTKGIHSIPFICSTKYNSAGTASVASRINFNNVGTRVFDYLGVNCEADTSYNLKVSGSTYTDSLTATTVRGISTLSATTISGATIRGDSVSASTISGTTIRGGSVSASTISAATSIVSPTISGTTIKSPTLSATTICATTMYATSGFYETSDERLKNFKGKIPVSLERLSHLKKNYFTWKDKDEEDVQIGVSAQEIQSLYPEIVSESDSGLLTVAYDKLSVVALSAIDILYEENKTLKDKISKLESQIENINTLIEKHINK